MSFTAINERLNTAPRETGLAALQSWGPQLFTEVAEEFVFYVPLLRFWLYM